MEFHGTSSSGWWFQPSEKYESQMGLLFPIYGTIKHVPNHQPVIVIHPQISTINGLYKIVQAINMGGL